MSVKVVFADEALLARTERLNVATKSPQKMGEVASFYIKEVPDLRDNFVGQSVGRMKGVLVGITLLR
jgi:hypothetical protein